MNLERTILEQLNLDGSERMIRENVLIQEVRSGSGMTLSDIRLALQALERKEQVIIVSGEDHTRIKITAAGRARLLE